MVAVKSACEMRNQGYGELIHMKAGPVKIGVDPDSPTYLRIGNWLLKFTERLFIWHRDFLISPGTGFRYYESDEGPEHGYSNKHDYSRDQGLSGI